MKDECPDCKGLKDTRSLRCRDCRMEADHPRQGTAKDWHINNGGYYYKFRDNKRLLQHRVVMEEFLGRELTTDEHVHHIDGDKLNNSIENLEVLLKSDHHKHHINSIGKEQARRWGMLGHKIRWGYDESSF